MGESDKMSNDSVTNRECRAVPTPNVILLYDEHRDAVADAFVRYSRPYARFTFAVARLQQIFMLATWWKDPQGACPRLRAGQTARPGSNGGRGGSRHGRRGGAADSPRPVCGSLGLLL